MPKKNVRCFCGHNADVVVEGSKEEREGRIWWYQNKAVCPECYRKNKRDEENKILKSIENKLKPLNLPRLEGSEKQIGWASKIRLGIIDAFVSKQGGAEQMVKGLNNPPDEKAAHVSKLIRSVLDYDEAGWWIDHRTVTFLDMIKIFASKGVPERQKIPEEKIPF